MPKSLGIDRLLFERKKKAVKKSLILKCQLSFEPRGPRLVGVRGLKNAVYVQIRSPKVCPRLHLQFPQSALNLQFSTSILLSSHSPISRRSLLIVSEDRWELDQTNVSILPLLNPQVAAPAKAHTRISCRDRRRIKVAHAEANRADDWDRDGTGGTDDDGPEDRGLLAGCPGAVLEGGGPEVRCGHDGPTTPGLARGSKFLA